MHITCSECNVMHLLNDMLLDYVTLYSCSLPFLPGHAFSANTGDNYFVY